MQRNKKKNLSIVLAPFSIGGPDDAAKVGPSALMKCGIKEDLEELGFNVKVVKPPRALSSQLPALSSNKKNRIKNIDALIGVNKWLAKVIALEISRGFIPVTFGGDHSLAIGTIAGVCDALSDVGVLWIDRHFDAHSPKNTPSWRAHGMPVAVAIANKNYDPHPDFKKLLSVGTNKKLPKVKSENFVQIGIGEKSCVRPATKWYSVAEIDNVGIQKVINDALGHLLRRVKYVYVAWDIDSMNITGTGTSGDNQLTLREGLVIARTINKKIRLTNKLAGIEIMEVAPKLESKALKGQTANWATELLTTVFGGDLFNNLSRLRRNIHV